MTDNSAAAHLAAAEKARERVRRRGRWSRWLYIGYAVAGFVYITVCGIDVPDGVFWTAFALWITAACGLTVFATSRRVVPRPFTTLFPRVVGVWFVAWMIVFVVGAIAFRHNLAWWLPGAVVTSGIMLGGGWLDARAARR